MVGRFHHVICEPPIDDAVVARNAAADWLSDSLAARRGAAPNPGPRPPSPATVGASDGAPRGGGDVAPRAGGDRDGAGAGAGGDNDAEDNPGIGCVAPPRAPPPLVQPV